VLRKKVLLASSGSKCEPVKQQAESSLLDILSPSSRGRIVNQANSTPLAASLAYSSTLKREVVCSSETSVTCQTTRHYIQQRSIIQFYFEVVIFEEYGMTFPGIKYNKYSIMSILIF
jgi:hypothetical protein